MRLRFLMLGIILLGCFSTGQAQISNQRTKWVKPGMQPVLLDSLTIAPSSIRVISQKDTAVPFQFDPTRRTLVFPGTPAGDSIQISYRVFPFRLDERKFHRDPKSYDTVAYFGGLKDPRRPALTENREELFSTKGIQKTGNLTRGISFGNTQSVFVNSSLNLQLEGQLSDEITLTAAISDQNVPFQPEGNTQQLQEFDKVFVQIASRKGRRIAAGDIVLRNPFVYQQGTQASHFLRYYKNVQGGQLEANYKLLNGQTAQTAVSIAVAKGKFTSFPVEVLEGVQGPYRLYGPSGEKFIIVLANSERVYVDGRLLTRGFNFDYIIDYNTAEITFNPSVVITQFSRVRVDFEYSDRNYSRTTLNAFHQQQLGKFSVFANFYREKDNARNPLTLQLSDTDKRLLSQSGDNPVNALVPGVQLAESFNTNLILYKKADSLINNEVYHLFVHATTPADSVYQLQFSEVGFGKGNYKLVEPSTANGKVFEWVAPQQGLPQGTYEPIRLIPLPTQNQMLMMGGEYQLDSTQSVYGEIAFSQQDLNLFSGLDSGDDKGTAFKVGYTNQGKKLSFLPHYQWLGSVDFERDARSFKPVDRFRDVDFERNWSINTDTLRADDHIFNIMVGLRKEILTRSASPQVQTPNGPAALPSQEPAPSPSFLPSLPSDRLIYRFSWREKGDAVRGWQQRIEAGKQIGKFDLATDVFLLQSTRSTSVSEWQRFQATASYQTRYVVPGYVFSLDKNKIRWTTTADSVSTLMNFEENRVFIRNADSLPVRFNVDYSIRQDYFPVQGRLKKNTLSRTANASLQTNIKPNNRIGFLFTYRTLANLQAVESQSKEETIMGRLDWNSEWLDRNVRSELTYTSTAGRELVREYVFLPVPTGEGTHTWRDDNGDGRQDLNEFYEAINPDEKNYAKFFVPTDRYQLAYTQNFSYRLNLTTPLKWRNQGLLKSTLSRLSSVSAWTINRKINDNSLLSRFVPFVAIPEEDKLLSAQESLRSTLFFNRTDPKYGLEVTFLRSNQKQLLSNGFESRTTYERKLNGRLNLGKDFSIRNSVGISIRSTTSDYLQSRNFRIVSRNTSPELAFQPRPDFRLTASYLYAIKRNSLAEETAAEKAVFNQVGLETRLAKVSKYTLAATARWVQIDFKGVANSPVGYELLEALRPGTNWTWSVQWQQRLLNGLQLNMSYEGRQSEGQRVVHIGRMQVAALF